jgi:hypothetical protein
MYYSGRDVYSYYGDMTEYLVTGPGWVDRDWRPSGKVFTRGKVSAVKEKPRQR